MYLVYDLPSGSNARAASQESLIDKVSRNSMFAASFPYEMPRELEIAKVRSVFCVAVLLRSDIELSIKAQAISLGAKQFTWDERKRITIPDHVIAERIAAVSAFDGLSMLEAYVLMFGYDIASVMKLSSAEVSAAMDVLVASGVHLSWEALMEFVTSDIDGSLVNALLG
jgi:aminoglycoside N3'-acetyltransferase